MNNRKEFLIWTLLVPALLLSLSVWQTFRAVNSMAGEAQYIADLAEDIPALREIVASSPDAIIRFKKTGVHQPAAEALQEALQGQQRMERIAGQREITFYVAVLGVVSSVAVILAGLIGLWGMRAVRQASMRSRAALVHSFSRWQARLTVVLCVLAVNLCCAVALAVGFEFWDAELRKVLSGSDMAGMIKVSFFGITVFSMFCIGGYVAYEIWKAWRSLFVGCVQPVLGQRITPDDCSSLWELVRDVAERVGAQPPDTIVLGMNLTFFVMADDVYLYPEGKQYSGKLLYLSLPFMVYLDRDELTSIVAHELGHYAGEDLEYSQRFLPIYIRARRQIDALQEAATDMEPPLTTLALESALSKLALEPATMLARNFFDALDSGVQYWNRQREFAADAVSAGVVGPRTAALTLLRVVGLAPALEAALEQWREIPGDEDEELTDTSVDPLVDPLPEESPDMDDELIGKQSEPESDSENESASDTTPEPPAAPVNLIHLAASPEGVLTFVRHVLQKQQAVRECGEQAVTDPLRALHGELQHSIPPHPLDSHPLTAERLLAWGVDVDTTLVDQAIRPGESFLLWELGLLQHEETDDERSVDIRKS